jgi:nucleotide-binding universal stress UspA family protein
MYPANPPGSKFFTRLSSRSRNVIYRSCRPVLTVPAVSLPPQRILLAYDGSPKAQEGLFVTAYLANQWQVTATVLTVTEKGGRPTKQALAQEYLESKQISASFVTKQGNVAESILTTAAEQNSNLIVMGGYGINPIREAVLGANIDLVLQKSNLPILICR